MAFSHAYPWQILTKVSNIRLTHRIDFPVDSQQLVRELQAVLAEFTPKRQSGLYHDGGWKAIGLVAFNGDSDEDRKLPGRYLKTPVLKSAPYMEALIDSFPCEKVRVRLLQLRPGSRIYWHYDKEETFDQGNVRLHIPIITNPNVEFQVSHEDCRWLPGELWYGDFSFPHRLQNLGDAARVHMVLDMKVNEYVKGLLPAEFHNREARRVIAQQACQLIYQFYNLPTRGKRLMSSLRTKLKGGPMLSGRKI